MLKQLKKSVRNNDEIIGERVQKKRPESRRFIRLKKGD